MDATVALLRKLVAKAEAPAKSKKGEPPPPPPAKVSFARVPACAPPPPHIRSCMGMRCARTHTAQVKTCTIYIAERFGGWQVRHALLRGAWLACARCSNVPVTSPCDDAGQGPGYSCKPVRRRRQLLPPRCDAAGLCGVGRPSSGLCSSSPTLGQCPVVRVQVLAGVSEDAELLGTLDQKAVRQVVMPFAKRKSGADEGGSPRLGSCPAHE